jgi:hemerythrin-like domain-containing protein
MGRPLKRHPALIPLSRDHHFGLLMVWKVRQGQSRGVDPQRLFNYINYFFPAHLESHFSLEKDVVFSYLAKNDLLRKEVEAQHKAIRKAFHNLDKLKEEELVNRLSEFCLLIETNIRFEERKFFQYLQRELQSKELVEMGEKIAAIHLPVIEKWADKFWEK